MHSFVGQFNNFQTWFWDIVIWDWTLCNSTRPQCNVALNTNMAETKMTWHHTCLSNSSSSSPIHTYSEKSTSCAGGSGGWPSWCSSRSSSKEGGVGIFMFLLSSASPETFSFTMWIFLHPLVQHWDLKYIWWIQFTSASTGTAQNSKFLF